MKIKKYLVLCMLTSVAITIFTACATKDKETVISKNVSQDIKSEEKEIRKIIDLGNIYLQQGKYDDARKSYEKSISMDKGNKYIYLEIKDKYIEKGRLDDGFSIIKLALDNKVDYDSMKDVLEEIKKKFEITNVKDYIYQDEKYILPKSVTIKINEKDIEVPVKWNNTVVDTNKVGTYTFDGIAEECGRPIKLTLNVESTAPKVGYVTQVYESDGNKYLKFDEAQFLMGAKGVEERKKNAQKKGLTVAEEMFEYDDGWFIKDDDEKITTYKISNNALLNLHAHLIDPYSNSDLKQVSFEIFKNTMTTKNSKIVENNGGICESADNHNRMTLCWIYLEKDVIVKVQSQYTP